MVVAETDLVELGQIGRTERAFRLDAWGAMKGDIVRALVEYVTNADDAYVKKGSGGKILIEVEHRRGTEPWFARVRDRATGMSLREMQEKIGKQGVRASGFSEGLAVRGNLGLGSKDPACFGRVIFESVKDGEYALFEIDRTFRIRAIPRPRKATKELRERLSLPNNSNGTVVTIEVTQPVACPRHDTLKQILSNHIQLRDIMQDPSRDVLLLHANKPGAKPERLTFESPKLVTRVKKSAIPVPDYPKATAEIVICEAEQPFADEGRRSPTRRSGLLIKGRHAIYDCTLFGLEGNGYALAFTGYVKCSAIDDLADEFDESEERGLPPAPENALPIIDRRREGLVDEHPFVIALKSLAEAELKPLVAEREKKAKELSKAVESERTTRLLSQLAREAAKFMREAADDEEIQLPGGGPGGDVAPELAIIPQLVELPFDEQRTMTIIAAKTGLQGGAAVDIAVEPGGVISIEPHDVQLKPSKRRDDIFTATIRVHAGKQPALAIINLSVAGRRAEGRVEVVQPETPPQPIPPAALEFDRTRYRLVIGKTKQVKVRAPLGSYSEGAMLRVSSDNKSAIVLDGGSVKLAMNAEALAIEGLVRVQGRVEGSANLVVTDGLRVAHAVVDVVRRDDSGSFDTKLVPEYQGDQRAQWSADYSILRIMGEHPALMPLLGRFEDKYPGQHSAPFRVVLAELVTDAVVRRLLMEKYESDEIDAGTFYVEHYRLTSRFLARAHRIVADDVSLL